MVPPGALSLGQNPEMIHGFEVSYPSRGSGFLVPLCSMREGDDLPIPAGSIRSSHMVAEVIMSPKETALLRAARACGANVHCGSHMLSAQPDAVGAFVRAF